MAKTLDDVVAELEVIAEKVADLDSIRTDVKGIREVYFAAILKARKRVWIASPYFVPDAALRDAGTRSTDTPPAAEAQITITENASVYMLVEEIRKEVWIASWKRASSGQAAPAVVLQKRLLWEQDDPILEAEEEILSRRLSPRPVTG